MLQELDYQGDYIYKYHPQVSHSLFFKKMTSPRGFGPDLLMRAALPPATLKELEEFQTHKNMVILGVFGASLLPVLLFRRLPWLKYRSRTFRVLFSLALIFLPTNAANLYLLGQGMTMEDQIYQRHKTEFEAYLRKGDVRSFATHPALL